MLLLKHMPLNDYRAVPTEYLLLEYLPKRVLEY